MGKYSQNVLNILTALECKGVSNRWVIDNYHPNMTSQELDERIRNTLQNKYCFDFFEKMEEVESYLDKSGEGIRFTAFGDEDFPTCRFKQINKTDLPVFLAYKGDLNLLRGNNFNIAVIGLLNPTSEIESLERAVLKEILKFDTTIVSGLALGCDSIAHESVSSENCTIAILPSTLEDILPKRNTALADDIVANKNGLLISEYYKPPTNRYDMIGRYTRRDRLQALFSDMVILTASYSEFDSKRDKKKDSGSRHAMGKAKEYGIKRAVMHDENIFDNEMFNLNRELIKYEGLDVSNLNQESIKAFNANKSNRGFKIITRDNAESIIKGLKKWKEEAKECQEKFKGKQENLFDI